MTRPRLIEDGSYHHITRRCLGRRYMLRPDADVVNLFVYCLSELSRPALARDPGSIFRPRFHLLRYHGVLAPHASRRNLVVPEPTKEPDNQLALPGLEEVVGDTEPAKPKRSDWASLLARVFEIDANICPHCGGQTRIVAFVTGPEADSRAPPDNGRQLSFLLFAYASGGSVRCHPWGFLGVDTCVPRGKEDVRLR